MNDAKYIGFDVHEATITAAVRDSAGKLVVEAILETKAQTILQFVQGLRGREQFASNGVNSYIIQVDSSSKEWRFGHEGTAVRLDGCVHCGSRKGDSSANRNRVSQRARNVHRS